MRWLILMSMLACDPKAPPAADARVELEGMADGDSVPLVMGPQGGYHLDVGVRMYGVDPDGALLRYEVWETDGSRAFHADATYALRTGRFHVVGDHWERTGDRALLDILGTDEITGHTVDVSVVLELPDGSRLEDVRTVTVSPP